MPYLYLAVLKTVWLGKCCRASSCAETRKQQPPSCCSSCNRAKVLTVSQLVAKLLLVLVNILYLVLLFTVVEATSDSQLRNSSNRTAGNTFDKTIGRYVTVISAAWELVVIFLVAVVRVCCWLCIKHKKPSCLGFLKYLCFGDLQITSFLVPFGNVSLFQGDVWWLIVGII